MIRVAVLVAVAALTLAGCSGGDDTPDDSPEPTAEAQAAPPLATTAKTGEITGRLAPRQARRLTADVVAVVDGWIDAAYVAGDYPRAGFGDAFGGFTKDAARLARQEKRVMSNAAVGPKVDGVTAKRRVVRVDVLSPDGKPAGVTAHVNLVIKLTGDVERRDRISGRLLLTNRGERWRVFGYDVEREEVKGR